MNAYDLPTSLMIGEVAYSLNYGWRTALDIFAVFSNPDYDRVEKTAKMLCLLFPDWKTIPAENIREAIEKACDFLDCGKKPEKGPRPRLVDWEQDAEIIIPAVNQVANREVRLDSGIHWWTFFGWYMSIGGGVFASVLHIRRKRLKGKRLEKWEEEFYRENQHLIELKTRESREVKREIEELMDILF